MPPLLTKLFSHPLSDETMLSPSCADCILDPSTRLHDDGILDPSTRLHAEAIISGSLPKLSLSLTLSEVTMDAATHAFVIGRVNLARHSCVPWRCIATAIPLAPCPRSWHGGAEAMCDSPVVPLFSSMPDTCSRGIAVPAYHRPCYPDKPPLLFAPCRAHPLTSLCVQNPARSSQ